MFEPRKQFFQSDVFRCFHSLQPTQNLLDDLGLDPSEEEEVGQWFYNDELKDKDSLDRVLHYSRYAVVLEDIQSKFRPEGWSHGRFSDGRWPVLYTAMSPLTAKKEKVYYLKAFYQEESEEHVQNVELAISKMTLITHHLVDLSQEKKCDQTQLVGSSTKNYEYCRQVAEICVEAKAQAIRSHSARDQQGYCVPVFDRSIIDKDFYIQSWCKVDFYQGDIRLFEYEPLFLVDDLRRISPEQ
ncbi:MAG: RES family NAD+ phosphorylase [Bdellovibrionota bacterium]